MDQENLNMKVAMWKKENSNSHFHFQPYKYAASESSEDKSLTQTLLYVHQEQWQQELLKRYGNTISALMDATYKTQSMSLLYSL